MNAAFGHMTWWSVDLSMPPTVVHQWTHGGPHHVHVKHLLNIYNLVSYMASEIAKADLAEKILTVLIFDYLTSDHHVSSRKSPI